jgi:hypothetical protein
MLPDRPALTALRFAAERPLAQAAAGVRRLGEPNNRAE